MKVFISYSWDSDAHKDWVRLFADALIRSGIEVILDQYDLPLGGDRFAFMERSVRGADCVLCVCTPNYVERANRRERGVGVETTLITPQFFERNKEKQFIPVVRASRDGQSATPDYLSALVFVDFRVDTAFDLRMDEVLRHLHRQPKNARPEIGPVPDFSEVPLHILIIEDEIGFGHSLSRYLQDRGWSTSFACDIPSALELASRAPPDAVVMDVWYVSEPTFGEKPWFSELVPRLRGISPHARLIGLAPYEVTPELERLFDHIIQKSAQGMMERLVGILSSVGSKQPSKERQITPG